MNDVIELGSSSDDGKVVSTSNGSGGSVEIVDARNGHNCDIASTVSNNDSTSTSEKSSVSTITFTESVDEEEMDKVWNEVACKVVNNDANVDWTEEELEKNRNSSCNTPEYDRFVESTVNRFLIQY